MWGLDIYIKHERGIDRRSMSLESFIDSLYTSSYLIFIIGLGLYFIYVLYSSAKEL